MRRRRAAGCPAPAGGARVMPMSWEAWALASPAASQLRLSSRRRAAWATVGQPVMPLAVRATPLPQQCVLSLDMRLRACDDPPP